MPSQNMLILFDDRAVTGALSGGSWEAALPLSNMQTPRLHHVARSTDLELASTQFVLTMPSVEFGFRAVIAGPTNLTTAHKYRVRAYDDAALSSLAYDSGWVQDFTRATFGTLPWGHPNLWTGFLPADDPDRGVWIIHLIDPVAEPSGVPERIWKLEIDDQSNADGFVQLGRLFMGRPWQPSINFAPGRNGLHLIDNSRSVRALSGAKDRRGGVNPRVFRFGFDEQGLAEAELYDDAFRLMRDAGFTGQVFVIPDPDADRVTLGRRSMLGTLSQPATLLQAGGGVGSAEFEIEEQL